MSSLALSLVFYLGLHDLTHGYAIIYRELLYRRPITWIFSLANINWNYIEGQSSVSSANAVTWFYFKLLFTLV